MKTMKKGMKTLSMSLALVMVLTMVFSTVVFAETTMTYTKKYTTSETSTYPYVNKTGYYATNSNWEYQFSNGRTLQHFYNFVDGGLWMTLPFSAAGIPAVATVTSATLTLTLRTQAENKSTRLLVHNVTKAEYDAYTEKIESDATFYDETTAAAHEYAPDAIKNYIAAGVKAPSTDDTYQDGGFQSLSAYPKLETQSPHTLSFAQKTNEEGTVIDAYLYDFEYDVTDMISDGSLTEDRYLLLQRGLNINSDITDESKYYFSNKNFYVPIKAYPPTLTITYTLPDKAENLTSSHSLLDSTATTVKMQTGYGYQINFDGELNPNTVTAENVLLTDSEGSSDATIGYTVEASDDNKSIIVKFPYDDGVYDYDKDDDGANDSYYKWLTAGEAYTITLTDGLQNAWGETLYEEGNSVNVSIAADPKYGVALNQLRWSTGGQPSASSTATLSNPTISVGANGTIQGQMLWGYARFNNFTATSVKMMGILAVYDSNKNLKQVAARSASTSKNMRSGYITPRLTLTENLVAGDTVKFFVWDETDPLRADGDYAEAMMTITVVEQ